MMNEYIYHKPYFLLIHTKDFQVYKNLVFIFLFVVALPPPPQFFYRRSACRRQGTFRYWYKRTKRTAFFMLKIRILSYNLYIFQTYKAIVLAYIKNQSLK